MLYGKPSREADISIRVAAESFVLRALSSCARALPAEAQQWDVSGLLLDGQPFSREAVACWLACAYAVVDGQLAQLDPQDTELLSTVTGLTQVLAFADAVGSSSGLCKAACSQLQRLQFVVQLPEQTLVLPVADNVYYFKDNFTRLVQDGIQGRVKVGAPLASAEQCRDVQQQVAQQLSALLRLAHVLRLQPLLNALHRFILPNAWLAEKLLLAGMGSVVFSNAVLEAAGAGSCSSALSREAYVSSVLSQPCSLTPGSLGHTSLLKPTGPKTWDPSNESLEFDAVLLRDFAGGTAGDTVKVTLALFGRPPDTATGGTSRGLMRVAGSHCVDLPVQLLLGCHVPDAAALEAFIKV